MTEKDLPEIHRQAWLKAVGAMEMKNYGYVILLLKAVLKDCPEFLPARMAVRRAAVQLTSGKKTYMRDSHSVISVLKIPGLIKKDPLAAMIEIEGLLERHPLSVSLNHFLMEAALEAKMPEIAIFALETSIEGDPKDTKTMHELAKLYLGHKLPGKAVVLYERILEINPADLAAVKGSKDASAAESMQVSGWEDPNADYRKLLADENTAITIEQTNRAQHSGDEIEALLAGLYKQYNDDPKNVDVVRKIAERLEEKGELGNAVKWFDYAASLTGYADNALVRKASDLRMRMYDAAIDACSRQIEADPDAGQAGQLREELETLRKSRDTFRFEEAKGRVERNPTDQQLRYELGEILMDLGNYREAISELQKARNNPSTRLRAMSLLGRCYALRRMYDLAEKTLSEAAAELGHMDATKKDIVYNLGLVCGQMGKKEKSLECMKMIYEVDCDYLDVANRVEGAYDEAVGDGHGVQGKVR